MTKLLNVKLHFFHLLFSPFLGNVVDLKILCERTPNNISNCFHYFEGKVQEFTLNFIHND